MSDTPARPARQTILVSLVLTTVMAVIAYYVWIYANIGARMFARGTLLTDLRFFVGLLAVFGALSVLDRVIGFVIGRIKKQR
ncbi:MAG: hypothetical protein ABJY83_05455 [Roseibium sp.]